MDDKIILEIDTSYNIISAITRKLARENRDKLVVVINRGFFKDRDQIYIRGKNVIRFIESARNEGYSAGGKRNVAGITLPKEKTDSFIEKILK